MVSMRLTGAGPWTFSCAAAAGEDPDDSDARGARVRAMSIAVMGKNLFGCSHGHLCGCRPRGGRWDRARMRVLKCPLQALFDDDNP